MFLLLSVKFSGLLTGPRNWQMMNTTRNTFIFDVTSSSEQNRARSQLCQYCHRQQSLCQINVVKQSNSMTQAATIHIHHCHLLLALGPKADTILPFPQRVEG